MKINVESLSPIKKKISFEIPRASYDQALESALQKLQKKVQIRGFRRGKVPRSMLEKQYGAQTSMDTLSDLVDSSYRQAIQENQLHAVGMPKIEDLKFEGEGPITFTAEIEVQPEVKAQGFEKIPLKKSKLEVLAEELDREILALRKNQAQWIPLAESDTAAEGDLVTVDYHATVDGQGFEGGSGKNMPVQLGSGRFLKDFEQGIVGAKAGEKRQFNVVFPEEYGVEKLRGKTAQFEVEIHDIKREQLPEADDELAKDLGEFSTFDQVKQEIEKRILQSKEKSQRADLFQQMLAHLIEKNPFEIPEAMVDRELDFMWNHFVDQLAAQKMTPEALGLNAEDYKQRQREEGVRRIKGFLLFNSIAQQSEFTVLDEEIDERIRQVAADHRETFEKVKKFYQDQGLIRNLWGQILEEKIFDLILSKAEVKQE